MRFYVHGAGRAGPEAWPEQAKKGAVFADHSISSSMLGKADVLSRQFPRGVDVVLIAHSLGAVPAAVAYGAGDISASHVVLLEPALYDIARGDEDVERHIVPMTSAREHAQRGDLFAYWQIVKPMMFGSEATRDSWDEDHDLAQRFAKMDAPWGHDIDESVFADVPTLVLTGGWNDEYEAIADRLSRIGAAHVRLSGARHRPQDHRDFESALAEFVGTHHERL